MSEPLLVGRRRKRAVGAAWPWLPRLGLDGLADRLPGELGWRPSPTAAPPCATA